MLQEMHASIEDLKAMLKHLLLAIGQTSSHLLLQLRPQAIHPLVNGILQAIHLVTVCSLWSNGGTSQARSTMVTTLTSWVTTKPAATAHSRCRML